MKWRLRERLNPLLVAMRGRENLSELVNSAVHVIRNDVGASSLGLDDRRERALSRIVQDLAIHAAEYGPVTHWFALPFLTTGGAEMVALNLCSAVRQLRPDESVALLITDRKLVNERIVIPDGVFLVIFDDYLGVDLNYSRKQALLRDLLMAVRPKCFHNINSEVSWHLILAEGDRLRRMVKLYASIFAFQFSPNGQSKTGYAAYFLKQGMPHLSGLISDNERFIKDAIAEYGFESAESSRMHVVYQPCRLLGIGGDLSLPPLPPLVSNADPAKRPQVLWAGRLDVEKRVDLFLEVVRHCDFADFHVFGQVVLDGGSALPPLSNLNYEGPFTSPSQWIERRRFDAFLFTSKWEGMPNILIEAGALGIPVIAPTVGGVGELITEGTGYPLPERPSVEDYAVALTNIALNPERAYEKSVRLQELIERRHSWSTFIDAMAALPDYGLERASSPVQTNAAGLFNAMTAQAKPRVSVIVPCYNQGRYLNECISSVLTACHVPLEVIVVDDGSTDSRTSGYLNEIKQLAPDVIRVHRQSNQGLSGARNSALDLAKGDFIQFLDADDLLSPGKIDAQLAQFACNPQLDVSICNFLLCDETRSFFFKHEEAIAKFDLTLDDFLYRWERGFAIPIHCGLFRRRALKTPSFDPQAHAKEDWIFWTGLALSGARFGYIHGNWAMYRQHEGSMRRSYLKMGRAWIQAGLKIEAELNGREPLFFESVVAWFEQCYRSNPGYREEIAELQCAAGSQGGVALTTCEAPALPKSPMAFSDSSIDVMKILAQFSELALAARPPLFSVVVPIFGHYEYLEACLLSIADQGDIPIEIVCIDDASPDPRVATLMHSLANKLERLKIIIRTINCGISDSQNAAVSAASGDFVAFLDCDDELKPGALAVIRDQILMHADVDYFFTDREDIDERGMLVRTARYGGYEKLSFTSQENIRADLLDGMVASHLKVIRRSTYIESGGCDAKFSGVQDWDLALRIAESGKLYYVNQTLYRHRVHRESVTRSDSVSQLRKTNIVRRRYSERWLRESANSSMILANENFSKSTFPVELTALKESWRCGHRCVADAKGSFNISQINFLREFNSYFDRIEWDDPAVPASLAGYLWDRRIVEN